MRQKLITKFENNVDRRLYRLKQNLPSDKKSRKKLLADLREISGILFRYEIEAKSNALKNKLAKTNEKCQKILIELK